MRHAYLLDTRRPKNLTGPSTGPNAVAVARRKVLLVDDG
jgi:hypothetical protein